MKAVLPRKGSAGLIVLLLTALAGISGGCSHTDPNAVPPPSNHATPLPPVEHAFHKPKLPPLAGPGAGQRSAAMTPPKGP